MNNSRFTFAVAALTLGAVFTISPLQAQTNPKFPNGPDKMTGDGGMSGGDMMGMMNMMAQMNKMVNLCNKMMETVMIDTDGSKPQMPADGQSTPEKKS